jgi:hypothetical protein
MWIDRVYIGQYAFDTLVAVTADEHITGLMYRPWPPPVMVFPYKNAEQRRFWMKNTPSPLDIIFAHAGKIVGIFKGEPLTTTCVGPDSMTDLVIELPYGTVAELNILVGDCVKVCYSADTAIKIMKYSQSG